MEEATTVAEEEAAKSNAGEPEEWFIGKIKSYAPMQGYGFIECDDTFQVYESDVFLHRMQVQDGRLGRPQKGDTVRFSVEMNKKGRPQARNVDRYVEGGPWVPATKSFVGRVKSYSDKQGFGFIACEDTKIVFKSDIFIHKIQYEEA